MTIRVSFPREYGIYAKARKGGFIPPFLSRVL